MEYVNNFPIWASIGWGLGVWLGLAGSVLLLMKSKWAAPALLVSLIGAVMGIGYQLMRPADVAGMDGGVNMVMPYIILAVALGLFVYARMQAAKGLLR